MTNLLFSIFYYVYLYVLFYVESPIIFQMFEPIYFFWSGSICAMNNSTSDQDYDCSWFRYTECEIN